MVRWRTCTRVDKAPIEEMSNKAFAHTEAVLYGRVDIEVVRVFTERVRQHRCDRVQPPEPVRQERNEYIAPTWAGAFEVWV